MLNKRLLSISMVCLLTCMGQGCDNDSKKGDTPVDPGQQTDCSAMPGTVLCNGNCIDPKINQAYCGADEKCEGYTACVDGQMCQGGVCIARPATCIDAGSDINCQTDDPNAVAHCSGNSCVVDCKDGFEKVDGFCKAKDTPKSCDPGLVLCGNNCIDPQINMDYCGADDNCEGYTQCVDGQMCKAGSCEDRPAECIDSGSDINCQTDDPNAVARCDGSDCIIECKDGYSKQDGVCTSSSAVVCEPGKTECKDGSVVQCNSEGSDYDVIETCTTDDPNATAICKDAACTKICNGEYKEDTDGLCKDLICKPNENACVNDDSWGTCNATGTAFENTTACRDDQKCVDGDCVCKQEGYVDDGESCKDLICKPNEIACVNDDSWGTCNALGTGFESTTACREDKKCVEGGCVCKQEGYVDDGEACKTVTCTPAKVDCTGLNTYGTCNATGTGYENEQECAGELICNLGTCKCPKATDIECDGVCMNPNSDVYCGVDSTCNYKSCLSNDHCDSGECVCNEGFVRCGDTCIDPLTSQTYCGADNTCGNYTTCRADQTCQDGTCICNDNKVKCGDQCIDPKTDTSYCGADNACGNYTACGVGQTCQNGTCTCTDTTQVLCNGNCINPKTNNTYCGANSTCSGYTNCSNTNRTCKNGSCVCAEGLTWHSTSPDYWGTPFYPSIHCVDEMNSEAYCGTKHLNCYDEMINAFYNANPPFENSHCEQDYDNNPSCKAHPIVCDKATGICNTNPDCIPEKCEYTAYCSNGKCSMKYCALFEDSAIEAYALAHWDTDGNGCIIPKEETAVTEIPDNAFKNNTSVKTLKDLNKFNNLTKIGKNAFAHCTNLTDVNLTNVTQIGEYAFEQSGVKNLTLRNVKTIPNSMCSSCQSLASLDLPNVTSIGTNAFSGNYALETVNIPKATTIGITAFSAATKLKNIAMPAVTAIKREAFAGCTALTTVTLNETGANTTIDEKAFYNDAALKTVSGGNIKTVGLSAFQNCSKLESIDLTNVVSINDKAFQECTSLTQLSDMYNNLPSLTSIGGHAFYGSGLPSFKADSVTKIEQGAFSECPNLTHISLQTPHFEKFSWGAFYYSPNIKLSILEFVPLVDLDREKLELQQLNLFATSENGLPESAFEGCKGIKKVWAAVPNILSNTFKTATVDSVSFPYATVIDADAFALATFNKPENNYFPKVVSIGTAAFAGTNLTTISLPEVQIIGNRAFDSSFKLEFMYLPKLIMIGVDAFYNTKIASANAATCQMITDDYTCTGSNMYCVKSPLMFTPPYYVFKWDCPEGTTCTKDTYGHKICK